MQKEIVIAGQRIGYTLERKRVKNINLRIRPDGSVYVSAAPFVPQSAIDRLILSNAQAVLAGIRRAEEIKARAGGDGEALIFGVRYPVEVCAGKKNTAELTPSTVRVTLKDVQDEAARGRALDKLLREECVRAVTDCCERVYPRFRDMGVAWPEIRFRRMTGRWGSCQPSRGVITFATGLVHARAECTEYVVTHEFCHFIHPDHSPAFHALMTRLMPDWRARKKLLNETPIV